MKNESTLIALFQGMFENNILTFNPSWDQDANTLKDFNDVRDIQKHLTSKNITLGHSPAQRRGYRLYASI